MIEKAQKIIAALRTGCDDASRCKDCDGFKWCHDPNFTLEEVAANLIEELIAQLVNQATEYSQALKITTEQRDAAVADLDMCCPCEACTRNCKYDKVNPYDECADFEWRGLPKPPKEDGI